MSGEYYTIEEMKPQFYYADFANTDKPKPDDARSNISRKSQDSRLYEIEEQLEIAENKCNTLKGQLDAMKKCYQKAEGPPQSAPYKKYNGVVAPSQKSPRKRQHSHPNVYGNRMKHPTKDESFDEIPHKSSSSSTAAQPHITPVVNVKANIPGLVRQNSNAISTDHSGAAIQTINNILSGITNSVYRAEVSESVPIVPLSAVGTRDRRLEEQQKVEQIINQIESSHVKAEKQKPKSSHWSRHTSSKSPAKAQVQSSLASVNLSRNRPTRHKTGDDNRSVVSSKRKKKSMKRLKQMSKMSLVKKLSDTMNNLQPMERIKTDHNLVELFHNIAAKTSDSDDESNMESKCQIIKQKGAGDLNACAPTMTKKPPSRILTPINETKFYEDTRRNAYFAALAKNYELPTISSKMKQATKCYLKSFNFRSIPFCAARSTTPSHNIGINIQQVMSIIKTKQPVVGISPTLVHNISLAAGKIQPLRPLSALVSTLSSRMGDASQCPLMKQPYNYNQLQEMAKDIPEEPEDELDMAEDQKLETEAPCTDAAGDHQEACKAMWSMDPTHKRCTCSSQKGYSFHQVLSKIQTTSTALDHSKSQTRSHVTSRFGRSSSSYPVPNKFRTKTWVHQPVQPQKSEHSTLQGKEKNLKAVLKNLHDEFETLNTKYENLAKNANKNDSAGNENTLKQLEDMDKQLNQKEEEINMVMALYTEVLALKDQVKKLKEKASSQTIFWQQQAAAQKAGASAEPRTAQHLTQLLRQIQNYQKRCISQPQHE